MIDTVKIEAILENGPRLEIVNPAPILILFYTYED